jgi:hypothetical protein
MCADQGRRTCIKVGMVRSVVFKTGAQGSPKCKAGTVITVAMAANFLQRTVAERLLQERCASEYRGLGSKGVNKGRRHGGHGRQYEESEVGSTLSGFGRGKVHWQAVVSPVVTVTVVAIAEASPLKFVFGVGAAQSCGGLPRVSDFGGNGSMLGSPLAVYGASIDRIRVTTGTG